jgi:uncharacterized membrane protein YcjF (UPF0283 family)
MNDTTEMIPDAAELVPRPRIRFGAIVWGLVVLVTAVAAYAIGSSGVRRAEFSDWLGNLSGADAALILVITAGVVVLVLSLLALVRKAQRPR